MLTYSEFDMLNLLARIVNGACSPEKTSTEHTVCKVPTQLLIEAQTILEQHRNATDAFTPHEIAVFRHACERNF